MGRFFFVLIGLFCLSSTGYVKAQKPIYEITAHLDTAQNILKVTADITITANKYVSGDTAWFSIRFNAFSKTDNDFNAEQLKHGHTSFYFRQDAELAMLSDLHLSSEGKELNYFFKDESKETMGVILKDNINKTHTLHFSYMLKLPVLIDGLGYDNGNYFLSDFYPIPVLCRENDCQYPPYRHYEDGWSLPGNFNVKLIFPSGYQLSTNEIWQQEGDHVSIRGIGIKRLSLVLLKKSEIKKAGIIDLPGNRKLPYTLVFADGERVDLPSLETDLRKVIENMASYYSVIPFESLHLVISDRNKNDLISDGFAIINENHLKKKNRERYLSGLLSKMWVYNKFNINRDLYPWLAGGLATYLMGHYYEDFIRAKNNNGREFSLKSNCLVYENYKERLSSPMNTPFDQMDTYTENFHRMCKPSMFFQYAQDVTSRKIVDQTILEMSDSSSLLTPASLIKSWEKASGIELNSFLFPFYSENNTSDYEIKDVKITGRKYHIFMENKGIAPYPFILTLISNSGIESRHFIPGFNNMNNIEIESPNDEPIAQISLDKSGVLPETNRENNHFFTDKKCKHGSLTLTSMFSPGKSTEKELHIMPFPAYNDNDGIMAAATISNAGLKDPKNLRFAVTPAYSFVNKKLLGQAWLSYDHFVQSDRFYKIQYRMGIKSFDMNSNNTYDYSLRYIRLDPSISLHFKHPKKDNITSGIHARTYIIKEEYPVFNGSTFSGINTQSTAIFRLEYEYSKASALSSSDMRIGLEQQSYDVFGEKNNYLKLTGIVNYRFMYARNKNLFFRFFASGFLKNTQRESGSYQNVFTKGSIALIHQGFNDYTYDEYFFSRQNQSKLYDNQVSMINGGGFKTPVGSANSIGMSNNFAAAVNFSAQLPLIPLMLYFDIGSYSTYRAIPFKNNVMYNGGLTYNFRNVVAIHLPLIFSTDLGNAYKEQHQNFFSRLSFSLNLHKLDFWNKKQIIKN